MPQEKDRSQLLRNRLKSVSAEQEAVNKRVEQAAFRPTETESEIINRITITVSQQFRDEIARAGLTDEIKTRIKEYIVNIVEKHQLGYEAQKRIERVAIANIVGLGPIDAYMHDDNVSDIIVQSWNNICIERNGKVQHVDASFTDEAHLVNVINRIVQPIGKEINLHTPIVNARLYDGTRVNAVIPPASPDGATMSIRLFPKKELSPEDYIRLKSLNLDMLNFVAKCIEAKLSILFSGGTTAGKTSLMNMFSSFIPEDELLITIEDSCELKLRQPNVRRLEARTIEAEGMMPITIQSLVKNALRMRPDRIIVGEIRDGTIVDMISAMSTGHEGSMSTVHANNPANLVNVRLPILYSMNESVVFSEAAQHRQIAEAVQLIVHISKVKKTGKRKVTHITHVDGIDEKGRVRLKDIFLYDEKKDEFYSTGYCPKEIIRIGKNRGVKIPTDFINSAACGNNNE